MLFNIESESIDTPVYVNQLKSIVEADDFVDELDDEEMSQQRSEWGRKGRQIRADNNSKVAGRKRLHSQRDDPSENDVDSENSGSDEDEDIYEDEDDTLDYRFNSKVPGKLIIRLIL